MSETEQPLFIYVADTSFFIEIHKRYPQKTLPGIWKDLEALIRAGRIVAPVKVRDEINQQDDELKDWVNNQASMFKAISRELLETTTIVVNKYPRTAKPSSQKPHHADPFVIGLAMKMRRVRSLSPREVVVVAEEKSMLAKNPALREEEIEKIPDVCSRLNVPCMGHLEMFKREGFRFY
jgi:hypothetical protein